MGGGAAARGGMPIGCGSHGDIIGVGCRGAGCGDNCIPGCIVVDETGCGDQGGTIRGADCGDQGGAGDTNVCGADCGDQGGAGDTTVRGVSCGDNSGAGFDDNGGAPIGGTYDERGAKKDGDNVVGGCGDVRGRYGGSWDARLCGTALAVDAWGT